MNQEIIAQHHVFFTYVVPFFAVLDVLFAIGVVALFTYWLIKYRQKLKSEKIFEPTVPAPLHEPVETPDVNVK